MPRSGLVLALLFVLLCHAVARADDVSFMDPVISGVPTNVITVNLRSHQLTIRPIIAQEHKNNRASRVRSFRSLLKDDNPVAAVNGTFFDANSLRTIGTIVENGHLVYDGYIGNAIAVDRDGVGHFLKVNRRNGKDCDWSPYAFAISCGPTLVYDGQIDLDPRSEGFRDPRIYAPANRTAIGVTPEGRLLLVTIHRDISLSRLAGIMKALGAQHALNLDGGSSSAMYYKGSFITAPGRSLTNILTVCRQRQARNDQVEKGDLPDTILPTGYRHHHRDG